MQTPTICLLLKQEVQLLKQSLLPQCPTNELRGYQGIPIKDFKVMEIEKNQPKWRQVWLHRDKLFKLHYVTAPQHVHIDPTFCPIRHRRDWETFERIKHNNRATWLNYPLLLEPSHGQKPTEKYVVDTLNNYIH